MPETNPTTAGRTNPYPGPRSFETGETLYGRVRETRQLLNLLIAERIVLLYSPSGAGKTSLIQAALLPELQEEGFRVLPPMRVSLEAEEAVTNVRNRYTFSLLLSLDAELDEAEQTPIAQLAQMTLAEYLAQSQVQQLTALPIDHPFPADENNLSDVTLPTAEAAWDGDVLIFDQFEEILTLDPTDRAGKQAFFAEVGEVLQARNRWALFAMREEFIAGLDSYLLPIPTRFATTFRLELLGPDAARQAMQQPALAQGVTFTDTAAEKLIGDLRTIQVMEADGSTHTAPGDVIEPVQLQVVCLRLWEALAADDNAIGVADVDAFGNVDSALQHYYADTVERVAAETDVGQRRLREWVDEQLITENGIRGQVLMGHGQTAGLANGAIWQLVDAHLVRAEKRRGATWFELAHDRLLGPVQEENAAWFVRNLTPFQRQAAAWDRAGRPAGLVLHGAELYALIRQFPALPKGWTATEEAFYRTCYTAWERAEQDARQRRQIRWLAIGATVVALIAIIFGWLANSQRIRANQTEKEAVAQSTAAAKSASVANSASTRAVAQATLAAQAQATADANLRLAQQQIEQLHVAKLIQDAQNLVKAGDAFGAISKYSEAETKGQTRNLSAEKDDARRQVATQLTLEGEMLAKAGIYSAAGEKFRSALALEPPPDTPVYIWIQASEFTMGADGSDDSIWDNAKPQQIIYVNSFWILRTEVTNSQYQQCVKADICTEPNNNRWHAPQFAQNPVTNVDWFQARIYSEWVGGRLPNEAEWEKACRGTAERTYSWGDDLPSAIYLNYAGSGLDTWANVGSYPPGGYGLHDMLGNVWEWTTSRALNYPYDPDDGRETFDNSSPRMLRGGGFDSISTFVRCDSRLGDDSKERSNDYGFRVVISLNGN